MIGGCQRHPLCVLEHQVVWPWEMCSTNRMLLMSVWHQIKNFSYVLSRKLKTWHQVTKYAKRGIRWATKITTEISLEILNSLTVLAISHSKAWGHSIWALSWSKTRHLQKRILVPGLIESGSSPKLCPRNKKMISSPVTRVKVIWFSKTNKRNKYSMTWAVYLNWQAEIVLCLCSKIMWLRLIRVFTIQTLTWRRVRVHREVVPSQDKWIHLAPSQSRKRSIWLTHHYKARW